MSDETFFCEAPCSRAALAVNDAPSAVDLEARELLQLVVRAHRKLDEMGVPAARPDLVMERSKW